MLDKLTDSSKDGGGGKGRAGGKCWRRGRRRMLGWPGAGGKNRIMKRIKCISFYECDGQ